MKGLLSTNYEAQARAAQGLSQLSTNDYQALLKIVRPKDYPPNPIYNGKPLSEWLYDLDERAGEKARLVAAETIKGLGTNVLPLLTAMLQIKNSGLEELLIFRGLPIEPASSRRYAVADGFQVLGASAAPAIPNLARLLGDDQIGHYVARALEKIGRDSIPTLLEALSDPNRIARKCAAEALGAFGENSDKVVPELVKCLKDEEADVRANAADSLRVIKKEATIVVPALIESLADTNSYVRFQSAAALGAFGNDAAAAVPLLKKALNDPDSNVRDAAKGSLFSIEGPKRK